MLFLFSLNKFVVIFCKMKYFNLAKDGTPEILINRNIDEYKAHEIATELFETVSDVVRFRINSFGGNVKAGMLILSAMQAFISSGGKIETYNMGVADSAASWILSAGSKGNRYAYEFSRVMIHPPVLSDGQTIDQLPDGDLKNEMNEIFDSLILILSSTTGKNKNTLRSQMKKETRFRGQELVTNGFVDKILKVKNQITIPENAKAEEIIEIVNNSNIEIFKPNNNNLMKEQLTALFNLNKEASDSVIVEAVREAVNNAQTLQKKVDSQKEEIDNQKETITSLTDKVNGFESKDHEVFLNEAEKSGKITKEKRETFENLIKTSGFDTVKGVIDAMEAHKTSPNIENLINENGNTDEPKGELKDALEYYKGGMKDTSREAAYKAVCNKKEFQNLILKGE